MKVLFYLLISISLFSCGQSVERKNTALAAIAPAKPSKTYFYCGSATKKGTACKMKVSASGQKCYHHNK